MASPFDNRLRPAVEIYAAIALLILAFISFYFSSFLSPLLPGITWVITLLCLLTASWRLYQGYRVLMYRRRIRKLPMYVLDAEKIPFSHKQLFLGRGFKWNQNHSQRLLEARDPDALKYIQPGKLFNWARKKELDWEGSKLAKFLGSNAWYNPVKPLPPIGGDPALHGVGLEDEADTWMDLGERVGHTLILGTTRVGKTRLAELLVTQDIRRGDVVIMFDPKGDLDLLKRMWAECKRSNRLDKFHIFHLGYPEISERYNPIGDFGRITEVASRMAGQLPAEGNSAAFREFAWRFSNVVAMALVAMGRKPDYKAVARYVTNIEPLVLEYFNYWLAKEGPEDWKQTVDRMQADPNFIKSLPLPLKSRDKQASAMVIFYKERGLYDPVCEGLKGAFEYDKTYFDKLTASLLPLMEKLTSGRTGQLLAPDYLDMDDKRPVLDWMSVIREGGVVYVGLDSLSDNEVGSAVGNSMFADLTSIAGRLYKHGAEHGMPEVNSKQRKIALHADEFNELVGKDFIPMVNKAGGAGFQVNAYTQTGDDIMAGIGSQAQAGQIRGNLNTLIMLRVKDPTTAEFMTDQLSKVSVYKKVIQSSVTDNNDPDTMVDFTSSHADRLDETEVDMLTPADLMSLPKGQAFAVWGGGYLHKLRLPLAGKDPLFPEDMQAIEAWAKKQYGITEG